MRRVGKKELGKSDLLRTVPLSNLVDLCSCQIPMCRVTVKLSLSCSEGFKVESPMTIERRTSAMTQLLVPAATRNRQRQKAQENVATAMNRRSRTTRL